MGRRKMDESGRLLPMEMTICEVPFYAFSKRLQGEKFISIVYPDGTYVKVDAAKGFPGPMFPGFLDVILAHCQKDLFNRNYAEISVNSIFGELGIDKVGGSRYKNFKEDMERAFTLFMKSDRFYNPVNGSSKPMQDDEYFRIFSHMKIAKSRDRTSRFYFDDTFLLFFRAGYMKSLDYDFCIELDKDQEALARFLYQHLMKRLGDKPFYTRKFVDYDGGSCFLMDVGLGYLVKKGDVKQTNKGIKRTLYPALEKIRGKAFACYGVNGHNIEFYSYDAEMTIKDYRTLAAKRLNMSKQDAKRRKEHEYVATTMPDIYIKQVDIEKASGGKNYYEDLYLFAKKATNAHYEESE